MVAFHGSSLNPPQGVTLTELMIAMTLGLMILHAGFVIHATYAKTHRLANANQFAQDQASYVFYWLHKYSRLSRLSSDEALAMPDVSDAFKAEFVRLSKTTENRWLAFRMKLPKSEAYSCEGSAFQWPNNKSVSSDVMVIFWLGQKQRLLCKTWVKHGNTWCVMPINEGQCTLFGGSYEAFLQSVWQFNFTVYPDYFRVQLQLASETGVAATEVYESQFMLRQKQWSNFL